MHASLEQQATASFEYQGQDIPSLLRVQAAKRANHPFLRWEPRSGRHRIWTYAQFHEAVYALMEGVAEAVDQQT